MKQLQLQIYETKKTHEQQVQLPNQKHVRKFDVLGQNNINIAMKPKKNERKFWYAFLDSERMTPNEISARDQT